MKRLQFTEILHLSLRHKGKEFLIFCIFLLLAGVFWCMTVLNNPYEITVSVPVRLTNIPANVVITTDVEDSVRVTLKDKGFNLMAYADISEENAVEIDFRKYASDYHGIIPQSAFARDIHQLFSKSTIVTIKPEHLEFFYNYGANKKVPVMLAGKVSPDKAYYLSQVKFWPDSVTIYATKSKLDSIESVSIRPVAVDKFKDTIYIDTNITPIIGVKCVPSTVKMGLFPDIYTEENINVPIACRNLPKGVILRTFPSKAMVHFVTGMKQYKELNVADFIVEADYNEIIREPGKKKCKLRLRTIPDCIQRAQLITTEVDFLLEE